MKVLPAVKRASADVPIDPPTASNVTLLDTLVTSLPGACDNFWVTPDKRVFACGRTTVVSVDATDPSNMVEVDVLQEGGFNALLRSCCVVGNYLYIIGSSSTNQYMSVIDISDPANMTIANPNTGITIRGDVISTDGTYLYSMASSGSTFLIIGLIDPINPVLLSTTSRNTDYLLIQDNAMSGVANELILFSKDSIIIYDVIDKENPVFKSQYAPNRVSDRGYYAKEDTNFYYTTGTNDQVETLDISDLALPAGIGSVTLANPTSTIQGTLGGPLLFVTMQSTLVVVDKSDPTNPTEQSTHAIDTQDGNRMIIEGNILFTCGTSVRSIDVA